jgi:LAO/AO transport system kinase
MTNPNWEELFLAAKSRDDNAISEILTRIERGPEDEGLFKRIHEEESEIYTIAVTGPPGAGKSTLLSHLAEPLTRHQYLGIAAMDPRSSVSGGAFLGDRIRLGEKTHHPRIFFRSFAPQVSPFSGYLIARMMARVFGVSGFGCAVIETAGVGQTEWPVHHLADTTLLLFSPESGDEIQMMKRGLIEWADIYVINKADRPGAKQIETALQKELHHKTREDGWKPPLLLTIAQNGTGTDAILEAIEKHHQHLKISGALEKNRHQQKLSECLLWSLSMTWNEMHRRLNTQTEFKEPPYHTARKMLKEIFHDKGK